MKKVTKFIALLVVVIAFASCSSTKQTMRDANARVELQKSDFTFSEQVSAEATTTKVFGIDLARLFVKNTGTIETGAAAAMAINIASIPVVGNVLGDKTCNYALYELMQKHPGYDVVFYPQYETKVVKPIGIGFLLKTTTVKVKSRLGKLK